MAVPLAKIHIASQFGEFFQVICELNAQKTAVEGILTTKLLNLSFYQTGLELHFST